MTKIYRQGAVGALLDEYERAVNELEDTISTLDRQSFLIIVDTETKDKDCVSIQSVLYHVVKAGYGYANRIRKQFGDTLPKNKEDYEIITPADACRELKNMLAYTEETLNNKYNLTLDDILHNIMKSPTGQNYDFEQLLEHAIVHILRHRRQVEMFKLKMLSDKLNG
ncbi:MAG: DinB family protein [Saprospiraceae bacterium]|nr:DinB family protein [Saprospiraceae bacterium]